MSVRIVTICPRTQATKVAFGSTPWSAVNALRHSLLMDVPVLAPKEVTFLSLSGPLETEQIAHRIGQLPIAQGPPPDGEYPWLPAAPTAPLPLKAIRDALGPERPALPKDVAGVFEIRAKCPPHEFRTVWSTDIDCIAGDCHIAHYLSPEASALAFRDRGFHVAALHGGQILHCMFTVTRSTARKVGGTRWAAVCPPAIDIASNQLTISTNGACTPTEALLAASKHLVDLCDNVLMYFQ